MAFTQADLETIERAIASGAKVVEYADKRIENATLDELLQIRRIIRQELGLEPKSVGSRRFAQFNKGVYPDEKR